MFASLLLLAASQVSAPTDFGVRTIGGASLPAAPAAPVSRKAVLPRVTGGNLATAVRVGARFGRVTSTWRTPEHNRRVGGARNSWHLQGRAIDIARNGSATHSTIAAEMRRSGLYLIESIDEGDHSHFAFGSGPVLAAARRSSAEQLAEVRGEASYFRFAAVPKSGGSAGSRGFR